MRLGIVVSGFPVTSETFIFNKVMGLRAAGVDVHVQAHGLKNDVSLFGERLENQSLDFVSHSLLAYGNNYLPRTLARALIQYPRCATRLWQHAQSIYGKTRRAFRAFVLALPLVAGNYDIIHFEFSGITVLYLDALPLLVPAKLVTSCRGAAEQITPLMQPDRANELRQVFSRMDRVHCVSKDMQQTVQQYGLIPDKAFINHPSIDANLFRRQSPYKIRQQGSYKLLSTGRLHWKKGFDDALLAVRQLLDEGFDVRYDILGSGPEEERLRFAIHDLGLSEHVKLLGRQPASAVRAALENADVYLLPSLSEGLSNAALEAMAMEVPLVSTTAGGMAEAITSGCEGFLVSPRQPAEMASKIKLLLEDGELRRSMGSGARQRIETHFNLETQIANFLDVYQSLLNFEKSPNLSKHEYLEPDLQRLK